MVLQEELPHYNSQLSSLIYALLAKYHLFIIILILYLIPTVLFNT